jgi:hypothetical protein
VGEWISKAVIVTYADDTTVYFWGRMGEEVREGLEMAAKEFLEHMKVTQLAANAEKTGFLMFGPNGEEPIEVGDTMIKELTEEKMLGVIITKDLGWKTHCKKLQSELRSRIAVIRRLKLRLRTVDDDACNFHLKAFICIANCGKWQGK